MSDIQMPSLKSAINCMLDVGHRQIELERLHPVIQQDPGLALLKLKEWEFKGWIKLVKNPLVARLDEICVEAIAYIDDEEPWSDPWSGKM